jgi:hypothetical protein
MQPHFQHLSKKLLKELKRNIHLTFYKSMLYIKLFSNFNTFTNVWLKSSTLIFLISRHVATKIARAALFCFHSGDRTDCGEASMIHIPPAPRQALFPHLVPLLKLNIKG